MAWAKIKGFNFRSTAGYVADGTNETHVLGTSTPYPTTLSVNGESVTFGWESGPTATADRSTAAGDAPELSGINYSTAASGTDYVFRVDLPVAGTYQIRLGAGDAGSGNEVYFVLQDTSSVLTTVGSTSTFVSADEFMDFTGATYNSGTLWHAGNVQYSATFATTICRVVMKGGVSNANVLAYFELQPPAGAPAITAQPVAQIAASGATATFSVTATGATSYQWYSAPITSLYENVPGSWSSIGGATSSSYTTGTLSNSNNGTWYYCAVTNTHGTTNTAAVRLWITAQPSAAKGLLLKSSWAQDYRYRRFSHTDGLARKTFNFGETDQIGYVLWTTYLLGASAGNVTVALSGTRITSTSGTLKAASALALSGNHLTLSGGTLKLGIGPLLTGSRITSSGGSLSFKSALSLTGQKITFSPGTITASTGSVVTVNLTGQQITSVAGNLTANRALGLSGARITGTAGSLIGARSLALGGQHINSAQGSLGLARTATLTGAKITSGVGIFLPAHAYLLTGQHATSTSGTVTASQSSNVTVSLTGLRITLTAGTISASGGTTGTPFSVGLICNVGTLVNPDA